ncbi:hypothetical protein Q4519_08800 [Motilimonas sp. 1_MG-2023]|nr:hypothetical protein [Motilimonas sp. 1_MG-2023]
MMTESQLYQVRYLGHIAKELDAATHGKQGSIIERASKHLNLATSSIYEKLGQIGWQSSRKPRSDKGVSKIDEASAAWVSNLILQSERQNNKSLMSVEDAIDIAFANGKLSEKCSAKTMLRKMEDFGVHPKQIKARPVTRTMSSRHPNHVWQFDVSLCVLYYLKKNDGLQVMEESEFYKNKPQNIENIKNDRVLRYLVTDHYSGAFHLSYIMSPGETVEAITQFLIEAFTKRSDAELLHGIPYMLIWDAGSANQATVTKSILDKLDIQHEAHTPGKPWAKGQVESMHNVIEKKFESRLAFMAVNNVDELNKMATQWSVGFQSNAIHTRHKKTRYGLWQTISPEQLRIAPDMSVIQSFAQTRRVERTVKANDLSITFVPKKGLGSMTYSLHHLSNVHAGGKVFVSVNLYRCPAIDVEVADEHGELHSYVVEPTEKDEAGFPVNAPVYGEMRKAIAETRPQKNRKQMDTAAWGTSDPLEIKKARKGKRGAIAFSGDINPMADVEQQCSPHFMQRPGTPHRLEAVHVNEVVLSDIQAWKHLASELSVKGAALTAYKKILKQQYPNGVTSAQLDQFVEEMEVKNVTAQATAL